MEPDRARRLLTAALDDLDRNREYAERTSSDTTAHPDTAGEFGSHPGDNATDVTDVMDAELSLSTNDHQRRLIDDALRRLDEGTYGRCTVCDRTIDDERLEARPEASTCRDHAGAVTAGTERGARG
jgi:RNA polymerase-binding transcription factor DksA